MVAAINNPMARKATIRGGLLFAVNMPLPPVFVVLLDVVEAAGGAIVLSAVGWTVLDA